MSAQGCCKRFGCGCSSPVDAVPRDIGPTRVEFIAAGYWLVHRRNRKTAFAAERGRDGWWRLVQVDGGDGGLPEMKFKTKETAVDAGAKARGWV